MEAKKCYVCGKTPLSKDEVGLTKKIIDKKATSFYCLPCLSEYLEVTEDELLAKIEEFKNEKGYRNLELKMTKLTDEQLLILSKASKKS